MQFASPSCLWIKSQINNKNEFGQIQPLFLDLSLHRHQITLPANPPLPMGHVLPARPLFIRRQGPCETVRDPSVNSAMEIHGFHGKLLGMIRNDLQIDCFSNVFLTPEGSHPKSPLVADVVGSRGRTDGSHQRTAPS